MSTALDLCLAALALAAAWACLCAAELCRRLARGDATLAANSITVAVPACEGPDEPWLESLKD
jgi:hypothetical protein